MGALKWTDTDREDHESKNKNKQKTKNSTEKLIKFMPKYTTKETGNILSLEVRIGKIKYK